MNNPEPQFTFPEWIKVGDLPNNIQTPFPFISVNNKNEIMLINDTKRIYQYCTVKNKWIMLKQMEYKNNYDITSLAYNSQNNELYISNGVTVEQVKINKNININQNEIKLQQKQNAIIINNDYHYFNGRKHYIFNNKTNKFDTISGQWYDNYGLIYIQSKNELLLIGGDGSYGGCSNEIYKCEVKQGVKLRIANKSWSKLNTILPNRISRFGSVLTNDEQYIILFGGLRHRGGGMGPDGQVYNDKIYIFNLETMSIKEITKRCPENGIMKAVITKPMHDYKVDLLIHGFIRNEKIINIPVDVINSVHSFYQSSKSEIHLFTASVSGGNISHWKICCFST
eukprot:390656_1